MAIVLGAEELKPISWSVWARGVESRNKETKDTGKVGEEGYLWLENGRRRGFLDIRTFRGEFAEWARGRNGELPSQ